MSFWIKENKVQFADNITTPLFSLNPKGGSIFIIKDDDNMLKVFYVVLGKGRVDLEFDVSKKKSDVRHMVALTWSLQNKELILYFDGEIATKKTIVF